MRKSAKRARIAQWIMSIIMFPLILKEAIKFTKFVSSIANDYSKLIRISDFADENDLDEYSVYYDVLITKIARDAFKGSIGAAMILKILRISAKIGNFNNAKEYVLKYAEEFGI